MKDTPRLRILFVPPRYYPHVGGVEEHCRGYANELARRGHEVSILCADDGPSLGQVGELPILRCQTAFKIANTNVTPGLPLRLAVARADVIHTFQPTPWSADWSAVVGKLRRVPVVLSYDNDIVGHGLAGAVAAAYNRLVLPVTLRAAARILLLSPRYAETSALLAPHRHKLQVIPPGIDVDRFSPDGGPRWTATFFFLSILDEYHRYKGLDVLLRAMAAVVKVVPEARLIIGGKGPLRKEFEALAQRLHIGPNVEFRGYVTDSELLTYYRRCTAFVLPSTSAEQEGYGIVAVEALACGAPVVVSNIVGIAPTVVSHSLGTVVTPSDVDSLAAALLARCRVPVEPNDCRGPHFVREELSSTVIGARLETLYRSLVAADGPE